MTNPEKYWRVKYMTKPDYQVHVWHGFALHDKGARQFAYFAAVEQGYDPERITHLETKRIN